MATGNDTSRDGPGPAPPAALSAFVSYSREDRDRALPVIRALEESGVSVWWDGLLAGGDAFAHTTEEALETAGAVVVVWTARSIQSHWVRDEATRGRDRGCMVPVSLDGTQPPLGFRQIQTIDLSDWRGKPDAPAFAQVLRAVRRAASAPVAQLIFAPPAAPPGGTARLTRRRALALGAGAAAVAGGAFVAQRAGWFGQAAQTNSIAVLPFRNLSGDPAQDYVPEGLSEELRATLSLNRQLSVVAETSSRAASEAGDDIRAIAGKLRVAWVLDGSVRRAGERLRITARLADASTGFATWAQSFDRAAADILAVQSEIATIVTDALVARVSGGRDAARQRIGGTASAEALDAFLRGAALYRLNEGDATDREALAMFDKALAIDPGYAAAHAARARALVIAANNYVPEEQIRPTFRKAVEAAEAAIRLAPDMAEGHSALGLALMDGNLDLRMAETPYQRSFELGYGNAQVLTAFADFETENLRFADARKAIERAKRLDPLNANVFLTAGRLEYGARAYDAAMAPLRTALSINPQVRNAHRTLGDIALLRGDLAAARAAYLSEPNEIARLRGLAIVDARLSGQAAGDAQMAALVARYGRIATYQQAQVLAQWGRRDEALAALERAMASGDAGLASAGYDPLLDPVRQAPGFKALLHGLGLPAGAESL